MLVAESVGQFFQDGHRLEFTEYGAGERWVVLVPSQLLPRSMHQPLARSLAAAGNHVITLDLLGHGRSDRPEDPLVYSISAFADQVIGLLDHLSIDRAVLGGTSLGANVCVEVAVTAPDRVQGLLVQMPVLNNALEAGLALFGPLLFVSRCAPLAVSGVRTLTRAVPRGLVPFWIGVGLDACNQRPEALAATVHGIMFGSIAPSSAQRRGIEAPALVVGHRRDPIHSVADAAMLAQELPDSRFVEVKGIIEWRASPERLTKLAVEFVDESWEHTRKPRRLSGRR